MLMRLPTHLCVVKCQSQRTGFTKTKEQTDFKHLQGLDETGMSAA